MNKKLISKMLILGCALLTITSCKTNNADPSQRINKSPSESMKQWEDQKFSMFIHWGLYSLPAGFWEGEKISGYSEQIKGHAKISNSDYRELAKQFNPVHWNADSVVLLAKNAGMRSVVFTTKHHDGFCMFHSNYTKYNVVDATPYKRDVLKELADACKRHDLKLGLYFSLIDWDYKDATPFVSTRNSDTIPSLHHQYNLNQIEELLTHYGQISEIWFDMGSPTLKQSKEMAELVKSIQPNCLISGRIWNDQGDFMVMADNLTPDFQMAVPWQTPASMFKETWSYREWQERPSVEEKTKEKIIDLIHVVSFGGNYLLNIGPKGDGTIIPFEKQVLENIGQWLKYNGEAIYGTTVAHIDEQEWGYITAKEGRLYLHISRFPENNKLTIDGFKTKITRASLLTDATVSLPSINTNTGLEVDLKNIVAKDKYVTVVKLEYKDDLLYIPANTIYPNKNNTFQLTWNNATQLHSYSGHDYYSTKPTTIKLKWHLYGNNKTTYNLRVKLLNNIPEPLELFVNNSAYTIEEGEKEATVKNINLHVDNKNEIVLSLKDKSNPHKGFPFNDIELELK